MKTWEISRTYLKKVTLGDSKCYDEAGKLLWESHTLELPNKDNKKGESCILEGEYTCRWTWSPSKKKYTYEVIGVKNRSGIRIHIANYIYELLGCIAPCISHADMDHDEIIDGVSSGKALKLLEDTMQKKDFKLIIKSKPVLS